MRSKTEEDKAIRQLRILTDTARHILADPNVTLGESLQVIYNARKKSISLFPDKAHTFDMIYGRRFVKILEAKGRFFSTRFPFWN